MNKSYPFVLPPLPYGTHALTPYIDGKTIQVHHDTLFRGYVTRLNQALKPYPRFHSWSLERLIEENNRLPRDIQATVYNNAGGVYNHMMYFNCMTPRYHHPSNAMLRLLNQSFGSYEKFKSAMLSAGLSVFGSGWAWLVLDQKRNLKIITTANQDTPLPRGYQPVLPLDVWEHAYFLLYLSDRKDYIENWSHLINWDYVESNCLPIK